jgi:hypothetical protein
MDVADAKALAIGIFGTEINDHLIYNITRAYVP